MRQDNKWSQIKRSLSLEKEEGKWVEDMSSFIKSGLGFRRFQDGQAYGPGNQMQSFLEEGNLILGFKESLWMIFKGNEQPKMEENVAQKSHTDYKATSIFTMCKETTESSRESSRDYFFKVT